MSEVLEQEQVTYEEETYTIFKIINISSTTLASHLNQFTTFENKPLEEINYSPAEQKLIDMALQFEKLGWLPFNYTISLPSLDDNNIVVDKRIDGTIKFRIYFEYSHGENGPYQLSEFAVEVHLKDLKQDISYFIGVDFLGRNRELFVTESFYGLTNYEKLGELKYISPDWTDTIINCLDKGIHESNPGLV